MKKIVILLIVLGSINLFGVAKANLGQDIKNTLNEANKLQEQVQKVEEKVQNTGEKVEEKWKQVLEQKCSYVESRVDLRIIRYENNQKRHIEIYEQSWSDLNNLATKWKSEGKDTTKLENDLQEMNANIQKFKQDLDSFMAKMRELRGMVCRDGKGEFIATLIEARSMLEIVHQDVLGVRLYYQQTIRLDVQELKTQ